MNDEQMRTVPETMRAMVLTGHRGAPLSFPRIQGADICGTVVAAQTASIETAHVGNIFVTTDAT